jgi:hypothetical protein
MRAFVLQDWVTIRGASTVTSIVQNENNYLTLDAYQDAFFWLQVSELTNGSTATVMLNIETSPLKDETLFYPTQGLALTTTYMSPPKIIGVTLYGIQSGTSITTPPIARFVRWHITQTGNAATWDVTFRILVSANQNWVSGGGSGGGMQAGWSGMR